MIRVVTHSGRFHADDVYAVATLRLYYETQNKTDLKVVRTRDQEVIDTADVVVDVGKEFDPVRRRFDHHQSGLDPRPNNIPYAAFGLVWKEFGEKICGSADVADMVDQTMVQPIDADDNGVKISKPTYDDVGEYTISRFINAFVPTWQEHDRHTDEAFDEVGSVAYNHLKREITRQRAAVEARDDVLAAYNAAEDKRLIVLPRKYPWKEVLLQFDNPQIVIYPVENEHGEEQWYVQTVPVSPEAFEGRVAFPEEWAGKSGSDLVSASGISDMVFAHKGRFLVVAGTKESALEVATVVLG